MPRSLEGAKRGVPARASLLVLILLATAGCRSQGGERNPPVSAARPAALDAGVGPQSFYASRFSRTPSVPVMTELGRRLFFDPALSASGKMACASCHDPRFAYGPPNARAVQAGGPKLDTPGLRAVPSLRYLQTVPPFSEHHFDEAVDESADQGPTGGRGWDGRVDSAHDQARVPLLSPFEMANPSLEAVIAQVVRAPYAARFRETFGDDVFADTSRAEHAVLLSLEVFEQSPKDFAPYSSRYDAWLRGRGYLSAREKRGLALFEDPRKGNCARCHPDRIRQGAFPQFTDFGYVAIGVPRNHTLPANRDPAFHDLGLCGPLRTDLAGRKEYCGAFRAPTLRNVALRQAFFHNGVFHSLAEVVRFYAQRDSNPGRWYARDANGRVQPFDDLPETDRGNVDREAPFGRQPGDAPALSEEEIGDLVAFLKTLTDSDLRRAPAARP